MVVSPCTTFTLPSNVASFFLSRISSEAASIWIVWSRFCEKPCIALGTPCIVLCAAALPAIIPSAKAAAQALEAIRRIRMLDGENIILKSFWVGGFARAGPALGRLRRCSGRIRSLLVRRLAGGQVIQIHHDVAFEPHYLSGFGNPEPVGRERSVQQFDVDMFIRGHRALGHVDKCPRQARLVARRGLQQYILAQLQQLLLGIE